MTRIEIVVRQRTPVASLLLRCAVLALVVALIAVASGCATLTGESTQSIDVATVDARDRPVAGMHCEVTHSGGVDTFKSPNATLSIRRGAEPLEIECTRGDLVARGTAVSRGENAMVHSFIPGGSLGTMIDHLTGKMYTYPTPLRLRVGEHLRFEHSDAATAKLVAPVGSQIAATAAGAPAPAVVSPAGASSPTVAAAAPARASAVRVTTVAPQAAAARPAVVSDSLDARDLRMRATAEKP